MRATTPERIKTGEDAADVPRMAVKRPYPAHTPKPSMRWPPASMSFATIGILTPIAFLPLVEGATRLGLFPFVLNQVTVTQLGGVEIYVPTRREPQADAGALLRLQIGAIDHQRGLARDAMPYRKVEG